MSNNYAEGFFQSVDTIISQRLNEVAFDKTEICEIISQDTTHKNKYYVSNGALKYEAYAIDDTKSYTIGSRVYVTIPNGDYEARKLVMGIYAADEIPKDLYTNPFDYLVTASQIKLIAPDNQLRVNATKGNSPSAYLESHKTSNEVTFHYSGLGQFNYIGLSFSAITGFGGTKGEFQIAIDLLDAGKKSLLTKTENGKTVSYVPYLTLSSKQLYGNPYYLNEMLYFQHLFPFPVANWFNDLTLVKHIKITLRANKNFNYEETSLQPIIINDLTLYFGYNSSEDSMSDTKVVLDWDNATTPNYKRDEIEYDPTKNIEQQMSIDWRNTTTNAIYNETDNMQYPEEGKYNIYWLRYSESIGYKKMLETQAAIIISCYSSDLETYKNNLNSKDELKLNGETLSTYDKILFDKYVALHKSTKAEFEANINTIFIDIEASGTYWKTVQRLDAQDKDAYHYSFTPSKDWKKEQIKVIIKDNGTGDYIAADGLTFINKNFRSATGSNQGKQDTLRLTLAEGDDGIYNSYGIDNKLLLNYDLSHRLTVNYIDNTGWDPTLQKVIWKIPATATMIRKPSNDLMETTREPEQNFYVITTEDNYFKDSDAGKELLGESKSNGLHYIDFKLDDQFSYNKTNNTIYCKIIRYQEPNSNIITDEYEGSITLQFGLQHTAGTAFSFNIFPSQRSLGAKIDTDVGIANANNIMTLTARFENDAGIPFEDDLWTQNVTWSWYQYSTRQNGCDSIYELRTMIDSDTTNYSTLTGKQVRIRRASPDEGGGIDNYAIIQAKLTGWQNSNGKTVDLVAYYPIAAGSPSAYLAGASRVIYNSNGTNPSYDSSIYWLSSDKNTENPYTYSLISNPAAQLYFSLQYEYEYDDENNKVIDYHKGCLKPAYSVPTNPPKMAIKVYDELGKETKYIQPLLVLRNGYESKLLNDWDGATIVNLENNYILSSLMGAGVKNDDNTFTGVLMGAVGTEITTAKTGIYGMAQGALRYKLDEAGDFYVGTGDDNKIYFEDDGDEKSLSISSKNFILKAKGQGTISTPDLYFGNKAETGTQAIFRFKDKIQFNSNGTAKIGGWTLESKNLSYNLTSTYYTGKSDEVKGKQYAKADMIISTSAQVILPWTEDTSGYVYTYTEDGEAKETLGIRVTTKIGNNFGLTSSGKIYAKEVNLVGKITATSGEIGGASIKNGVLQIKKVNIAEKLTANEIDATNLTVAAANITGKLTASQIEASALAVNSLSFGKITSGTSNAEITAGNLTITNGKIRLTSGDYWISMGYTTNNFATSGVTVGDSGLSIRGNLKCGSDGKVDFTNAYVYGSISGYKTGTYEWLEIASSIATLGTSGALKQGIVLTVPESNTQNQTRRIEIAEGSTTIRQDFGNINFRTTHRLAIYDTVAGTYRQGRTGVYSPDNWNGLLFVNGVLVAITDNSNTTKSWAEKYGSIYNDNAS